MDAAILRREQYLRKIADMPSFSLGLTPSVGEESNWDNVVNISSQYQDVGAKFTQACSPSSEHQEEEQMEVCEKDAALEERGGGVEVVAEKNVVVEERVDGAEMVVEKDSALDGRGGGIDIAGEKDVLVDKSVDAVGMGCEKDSLVDKSGVAVADSEERAAVQLGEGSMMDKGKGIIVDDYGKELEIQMVEKQEVERRIRKITVPLRSPYMVRQINVGQFLTATEKVYQYWIMQNPNADMEYVFISGATMLMRMELLSLKGHAYVTASVLDVWLIILNDLERFKDPNSSTRCFGTTYPCTYTVVDPRGDDADRLERFKENLHHEFQRVPHIKLPALDLMFFPMIASEHSYVICFNIKNQRIDIIDNSSKSVTNDLKYGSVPSDLKYLVMEYLKSKGLEAKSNRFKSVKPTRIKMGNRSQLDRLRVKYAAVILSAEINELRDENKDKAMKFFKKK
nr:uncharacterized protein LOC108225702 [Ipomoea batatas]